MSNPPTMRMAELSRDSGVPVATIKYYLREGLLHRGHPTAPNQASYGDTHVRRLKLIRALTDIGDMSISAVRAVIEALDDPASSTNDVLAVAHRALAARPTDTPDDVLEEVDAFVKSLGWDVAARSPDRAVLAQALIALRESGWQANASVFDGYAQAAERIARNEVEFVATSDRETSVTTAVIGSVVFGTALTALRRMAQEHHSKRRLAGS